MENEMNGKPSKPATNGNLMTARRTIVDERRRRLLGATVAGTALAALCAPRIARAQAAPKIRVGFWPVAAGLPFFAAVEKGYFKEAGLDVEPLKFAGAQQVMEAMLSGRSDGSSNGTGSANLAIGEIAQPGLFKIFCTNPSNAKYVLDEFIVGKDNPAKTIAELKGKRIASGPGIQNVTLCKTMLERAGATGTTVIELPIGQHVASLVAGQVDACYTLEPTGTEMLGIWFHELIGSVHAAAPESLVPSKSTPACGISSSACASVNASINTCPAVQPGTVAG